MIAKSDNSSTYQLIIVGTLDYVKSNMNVWIKCMDLFVSSCCQINFTQSDKIMPNW